MAKRARRGIGMEIFYNKREGLDYARKERMPALCLHRQLRASAPGSCKREISRGYFVGTVYDPHYERLKQITGAINQHTPIRSTGEVHWTDLWGDDLDFVHRTFVHARPMALRGGPCHLWA